MPDCEPSQLLATDSPPPSLGWAVYHVPARLMPSWSCPEFRQTEELADVALSGCCWEFTGWYYRMGANSSNLSQSITLTLLPLGG